MKDGRASRQRLHVLLLVLAFFAWNCGDNESFHPSPLPAGPEPSGGLQGVARFYPEGADRDSFPPSLALLEPFPAIDDVPADWRTRPVFSRNAFGFTATIPIEEGTSLYGTGEIAGPLLRNGRVTYTWNMDSGFYTDDSDHLYQSHPWVLAVRKDGTAFGVLADTTFRTVIDLRKSISFSSARPFPVVVIDAESPQGVLRRLATLVGTIPLPPLWAIGFHQSRYSYYPESEVRAVADEYRLRRIPCDVIWMDIDYMDGYRVFTFDPKGFPDPAATNAYLHSRGFKSVWIIDPGVKVEPGYFVFDQGTAGDHWVLTDGGVPYTGRVWPGMCVFPDFTSGRTREWWAGLYKGFLSTGIDGVWNDMNEPAIFSALGLPKTMPETNRHRGDGTLPPDLHARYHNVYGMLMARATYEGMRAARPERRPFVLTRSNYLGGQRYAATWTGDNVANWDHLYWSITMILNLGLSAQPFSGPDIGGHNINATADLFARWIGVGALFPFSRAHKTKMSKHHEPWSFGPEVEAVARTAIERRYRLIPYLYTLFYEASTTGLPVMRPVFFADPKDPELRGEDHAFLLGDDLLVEPILTPQPSHAFREPRGIWRQVRLVGEEEYGDGLDLPILKIRGGAIVPLGRVVQNTSERSLDPLTLLVCLDAGGRAEGTLYEDAGEGYGYLEGDYLLTTYRATQEGRRVTVGIAGTRGKMPRPSRSVRVELLTDSGVIAEEGVEERGVTLEIP